MQFTLLPFIADFLLHLSNTIILIVVARCCCCCCCSCVCCCYCQIIELQVLGKKIAEKVFVFFFAILFTKLAEKRIMQSTLSKTNKITHKKKTKPTRFWRLAVLVKESNLKGSASNIYKKGLKESPLIQKLNGTFLFPRHQYLYQNKKKNWLDWFSQQVVIRNNPLQSTTTRCNW